MSGLNSSDVRELQERLLTMRDELQALSAVGEDAAAVVTLDQTKVGRLSRMDAMQAQSMSQETQRRRELQLKAIGRALRRIDQDSYGVCVECEEPVNSERLKLDPSVEFCLECAHEAERTGNR